MAMQGFFLTTRLMYYLKEALLSAKGWWYFL